MKHLKTFESYKCHNETLDFINDVITETQYLDYLQTSFINEGLFDNIKSFVSNAKSKIFDVMLTFAAKAATVGIAIWDKFKTFVSGIIKTISSFSKKHPILFKIIVICIIVMILLIATSVTAHAQTAGGDQNLNFSKEHYNRAIGYLDFIQNNRHLRTELANQGYGEQIAKQVNLKWDENTAKEVRDSYIDQLCTNVEQLLIQLRDGKKNMTTNEFNDLSHKGNDIFQLANKMIKISSESSIKDSNIKQSDWQSFADQGAKFIEITKTKFGDIIQFTIQKAGQTTAGIRQY
jgi:hypothetical protein